MTSTYHFNDLWTQPSHVDMGAAFKYVRETYRGLNIEDEMALIFCADYFFLQSHGQKMINHGWYFRYPYIISAGNVALPGKPLQSLNEEHKQAIDLAYSTWAVQTNNKPQSLLQFARSTPPVQHLAVYKHQSYIKQKAMDLDMTIEKVEEMVAFEQEFPYRKTKKFLSDRPCVAFCLSFFKTRRLDTSKP